jgi:hypothetical protein
LTFQTVAEYKRVFEPLLLEEIYASLYKELPFLQNPVQRAQRGCLCVFDGKNSVGPFAEVKLKLQKPELFKKEDVVLLEKEFDGKKVTFLGFLQEWKDPPTLKLLDTVYNEKVRLRPIDTQWEIIKVGTAHNTLTLTQVQSMSTNLREFEALETMEKVHKHNPQLFMQLLGFERNAPSTHALGITERHFISHLSRHYNSSQLDAIQVRFWFQCH